MTRAFEPPLWGGRTAYWFAHHTGKIADFHFIAAFRYLANNTCGPKTPIQAEMWFYLIQDLFLGADVIGVRLLQPLKDLLLLIIHWLLSQVSYFQSFLNTATVKCNDWGMLAEKRILFWTLRSNGYIKFTYQWCSPTGNIQPVIKTKVIEWIHVYVAVKELCNRKRDRLLGQCTFTRVLNTLMWPLTMQDMT